ncbi:MAG TPA: two-component system response regulator [Marinilabiliales bacterium]|nr:MAG: two-component system response regulator [Bacteroidetes bacterium GWA2_40_14]OFX57286.1 MAG: two-component system response regulator [Bacteroidetes bacterium GWC2_40_13]OFX71183.1 MAG: two-component system response regulator [Bacteroidetes bacterium GWD2_40_43]OFX92334.1 MAG: two-component system response regulator [Bacteroidetes bacterium GWE2_40_63]OFY22937.1 MAG: two-component system response regulator [Bacteroidetes bacterium GWF2_40_13]OFZ29973.1 MAG: two-component system response 
MENEAHILLVEDNHMDVILTLDAFKEARLKNTIHVARNGQEALDYLFGKDKYANRDEFPIPALILLDLKMPKIDGFEVLRQVKSTEKLKRIPIVILTSSKEEGDRALSYDIGANSYLLKPVSFEGFTEVVKKIDDYWFSLNIKPPENS